MFPAVHGRITLAVGICAALGLSVCAVDDYSGLLQGKVDLPAKDQDELDLEAAEAEMAKQEAQTAKQEEEAMRNAQAELAQSKEERGSEEDAEEEAEEGEEGEGEEEEEEAEDGEAEQEEELDEEEKAERAKQSLRERIAERARIAQASNYSFTVGSTVFVGGKKAKIVWDGRPDHEFVKVNWLEGKYNGKTSGIIPAEDCSLQAEKVVEIGMGRHLKKRITSAAQLEQKKKRTPKVKDTSRRRRSVFRRVVYGIKKLPMVVTIPFKGLKTGVDTITSEMTAHTGIAFNGSLIDLLNVGQGGLKEFEPPKEEVAPVVHKKRKDISEIVRNKTVKAVLGFNQAHMKPLLSAFTSELRLPSSELSALIKSTNLTSLSNKTSPRA